MGAAFSTPISGLEEREYIELKRELKTGDMVLFQGLYYDSNIVKCVDNTPFSHIGMVYRSEAGILYIWHSTFHRNSFPLDRITKTVKNGPQLNKIDEILPRYAGYVYVRQLESNIDINNRKLYRWMKDRINKSYEANISELLYSSWDCGPFCSNKKNLDYYFCSELVIETYIYLGLLDESKYYNSNEYTPKNFSTFTPPAVDNVVFKNGVFFSQEKLINFYFWRKQMEIKLKSERNLERANYISFLLTTLDKNNLSFVDWVKKTIF